MVAHDRRGANYDSVRGARKQPRFSLRLRTPIVSIGRGRIASLVAAISTVKDVICRDVQKSRIQLVLGDAIAQDFYWRSIEAICKVGIVLTAAYILAAGNKDQGIWAVMEDIIPQAIWLGQVQVLCAGNCWLPRKVGAGNQIVPIPGQNLLERREKTRADKATYSYQRYRLHHAAVCVANLVTAPASAVRGMQQQRTLPRND